MIDTTIHLETPEGIDLVISPAGPVARGLAISIDIMIRQTTAMAVLFGLAMVGKAGIGVYFILLFLSEWFYPVFFEVLRRGQTPGKRALGLRVIHRDGTPIGWSTSIVRNLLLIVDFLPFFYMTGVVSILCSRHFQRLGDLAAETLVINTQEDTAISKRERAEDPIGEPLDARISPIPLLPEEQRAILIHAERTSELSEQRIVELSELLTEITGESGERGARELIRIANGIAGRA